MFPVTMHASYAFLILLLLSELMGQSPNHERKPTKLKPGRRLLKRCRDPKPDVIDGGCSTSCNRFTGKWMKNICTPGGSNDEPSPDYNEGSPECPDPPSLPGTTQYWYPGEPKTVGTTINYICEEVGKEFQGADKSFHPILEMTCGADKTWTSADITDTCQFRPPCSTVNRERCVFPFVFDSDSHYECIRSRDSPTPWCATKVVPGTDNVDETIEDGKYKYKYKECNMSVCEVSSVDYVLEGLCVEEEGFYPKWCDFTEECIPEDKACEPLVDQEIGDRQQFHEGLVWRSSAAKLPSNAVSSSYLPPPEEEDAASAPDEVYDDGTAVYGEEGSATAPDEVSSYGEELEAAASASNSYLPPEEEDAAASSPSESYLPPQDEAAASAPDEQSAYGDDQSAYGEEGAASAPNDSYLPPEDSEGAASAPESADYTAEYEGNAEYQPNSQRKGRKQKQRELNRKTQKKKNFRRKNNKKNKRTRTGKEATRNSRRNGSRLRVVKNGRINLGNGEFRTIKRGRGQSKDEEK